MESTRATALESLAPPPTTTLEFAQLNPSACKTYLIACRRTRQAMLVDPVLEEAERYLAELERRGLSLRMVVDTHVHADHISAGAALRDRTGADYVMHRSSASACANRRVDDGDTLTIGDLTVRVLHTPGHTQDSITLLLPDRILTGDFLFLGEGGAGRTDLPGGDAGEHWDSLARLADLAGDLLVYPAHDYHGRERSTLAEERRSNPRLAPRDRAGYIAWLAAQRLGPADWMADVIRANYACTMDPKAAWRPLDTPTCEVGGTSGNVNAELVRTISAEELAAALEEPAPPIVLDVRQPEELLGPLGWIAGQRNIPVGELPGRLGELAGLERRPIVCVCRGGGRSATAAAILTLAGFTDVRSLAGGMARWRELGEPADAVIHGVAAPGGSPPSAE